MFIVAAFHLSLDKPKLQSNNQSISPSRLEKQ